MNHPSYVGVSSCITSFILSQALNFRVINQNFGNLNSSLLLFQVISNRDTLVKLLAKHTGNVSIKY